MLRALVLVCAGLAMVSPAQKEPDVADLPPEMQEWVGELRLRVLRESDARAVPRTGLVIEGGSEVFGSWRKTITTDAHGRASVRLPMGRYRAYPLAGEFALASSPDFDLGDSGEITILLQTACALAGRVVDERGRPLAGSGVDVWADTGELHFTADKDGRFRAERLTDGEHTVTARAAGYSSRTVTGTARPGRTGQVVVKLHRGATLTIVTECEGGPCIGASVIVDAEADGGETTVESDGAATYRDLPTGSVTISAVRGKDRAGELVAAPIERRLAPGAAVAVKLTLKPSGGAFVVRGSIVDKAGKPLAASVWAKCGAVNRYLNDIEKDGTFVLRDLPTHHCKIEAAAENEHATLESDGTGPVRFVLNPWRPPAKR